MLFTLAAVAFATENRTGMTTQILTATPNHTVVAAEFDAAAIPQRLNSMESGGHLTDGLGTLLAIAGHGAPVATIADLELGQALAGTLALDNFDVANSVDELVILGEPAIWHDLRIVAVNFRPVLRDPDGTLRAVNYMEVNVNVTSAPSVNEHNDPLSFSSAFYPVYQAAVANLDELYPETSLRPPGEYLVILPTATLEAIDSTEHWLNWTNLKIRKGYRLQITTLGMIQQEFGSATRFTIKQYIQQEYANGDLEYLMLIGDSTGNIVVPTWTEANPEHSDESKVGDNAYLTVDGDDYIPDILGGRVSVNSQTDIARYFTKVYGYETDPPRDNTHWFETAICVAGNYSDNTYPVTPVWNVNWARNRLVTTGCITDADTFYYHDNNDPPADHWTQAIIDSISAGTCLVFYRGWAAQDGWQFPQLRNQDLLHNGVETMHTGWRLPAFLAVVCGSADFAWSSGKCLAELLTVGYGSVATPNGAIVYYGASDTHTNTRHNNAMLAGETDAMLIDDLRSTGAIAAAGEMLAYQQFPLEREPQGAAHSSVEYYVFHVFNILGDPETQIYVCQPQDMNVSIANPLNTGMSLVDVLVQAGGMPLQNAVVTLRAGTDGPVSSVTSDGTGHSWVPIDLRGATNAQLTVWKSKYFLQMQDVPVAAADFDAAVTGVNWQDGGDNLPNPGETIPFTLNVQYVGTSASNVNATLTSLDPRITIVNGTANLGTLTPGQQVTTSPMSLTLAAGLADGEHPNVQVQFSGNGTVNRLFAVPVNAPDALMLSLTVNDGNGILEPNETASVTVTLRNVGHQNASNLTATVYSWDNSVTFPDNQISWGAVNVGQDVASSDPFQITLADHVTPGRQIQLRYTISNNGVLLGTRGQTLATGVVTIRSPTGPDAYGYYAYEDIDTGFTATPSYQWIELDPAHGGAGGTADTVRDDRFFQKQLPPPFTFTFYGQTYSSLWICSNGWVSFENPLLPEFRNWELPMTMAPWLLIAPYWEDLEIDTTLPNQDSLWSIWSRWDSPNRFIIMWRAFNRAGLSSGGNSAPEAFELILKHNATGDDDMLFQYDTVTQRDNGANPSNYSTVGIQNYYMQTGLTLTYANMYPPSMDSLTTGRAIRITTTPPDGFNSAEVPGREIPEVFALHEAYPNPFNPVTELRFDLPEAGHVSLKIYDVLGREQATLVDDIRPAGSYAMSFDARTLPSGLYLARLESRGHAQVQKLMLVK
jgi:hypothetical protein